MLSKFDNFEIISEAAIKKRLNKKNKMEEDEEEENMEAFDHNDAPITAISPKYFKQAKNKTERDIEVGL